MPRRKFNKEEADKIWKTYTSNLIESIDKAEQEGVKKGYSSYKIEKLWQERTREKTGKKETDKDQK